jgi:hypothetical protein
VDVKPAYGIKKSRNFQWRVELLMTFREEEASIYWGCFIGRTEEFYVDKERSEFTVTL